MRTVPAAPNDRVTVFPDPAAVAAAGAARVVDALNAAISAPGGSGRASIVLSGGSTPKALYELLATRHANDVEWILVDVYFGDERAVPPSHADSNAKMVEAAMLSRLPFGSVHRIEGERGAADAAVAYASTLPARFDVCLLGMGADGHTASLFPPLTGWPGLVAATKAPPPFAVSDRISLTPAAFDRCGLALAMITGKDKAPMLARVFAERASGKPTLPMSIVRPAGIEFLLDSAANG